MKILNPYIIKYQSSAGTSETLAFDIDFFVVCLFCHLNADNEEYPDNLSKSITVHDAILAERYYKFIFDKETDWLTTKPIWFDDQNLFFELLNLD